VLTLMMLLREEGHEVRGVYDGRQVLGCHSRDSIPTWSCSTLRCQS
jgi:hypothetical protein